MFKICAGPLYSQAFGRGPKLKGLRTLRGREGNLFHFQGEKGEKVRMQELFTHI